MLITITIHVILILLLLFAFGLKYMDPPLESGIAVNFGNSDVGSGSVQPSEPIRSAPKQSKPKPVSTQAEELQEEVITQEIEDAPVIENKEKKEESKVNPVREEQEEEPVEEEVEPDPTPDKATTDALSSLINAPKSEGNGNTSEGNNEIGGDKGRPDGDPKASAYYGTGKGLDGDGNYLLGGRRALNKEKYLQQCNEAGVVVVSIEVDRGGEGGKCCTGGKRNYQ